MRLALVLALCLAAGPALGNGIDPTRDGRTVPLRVTPLELQGGEYRGVRPTGAWRLESRDDAFGGVSGLLVDGNVVRAVTDQGTWVAFRRGGEVLAPFVRLAEMRVEGDNPPDKASADAEGLARRGGRLVVSFERDHRIAAHVGGGVLGRTIRDRRFEALPSNEGMEALTRLPDGRLIAIGEAADPLLGFPVFIADRAGGVVAGRLPAEGPHQVTGADVGPDRKLYVVRRFFSVFTGFSIRVVRYALGPAGLPDPRTEEMLAAWESASRIDNMEGIAAFRDEADGPVKLWLISDDNFNRVQRTILVELEVE